MKPLIRPKQEGRTGYNGTSSKYNWDPTKLKSNNTNKSTSPYSNTSLKRKKTESLAKLPTSLNQNRVPVTGLNNTKKKYNTSVPTIQKSRSEVTLQRLDALKPLNTTNNSQYSSLKSLNSTSTQQSSLKPLNLSQQQKSSQSQLNTLSSASSSSLSKLSDSKQLKSSQSQQHSTTISTTNSTSLGSKQDENTEVANTVQPNSAKKTIPPPKQTRPAPPPSATAIRRHPLLVPNLSFMGVKGYWGTEHDLTVPSETNHKRKKKNETSTKKIKKNPLSTFMWISVLQFLPWQHAISVIPCVCRDWAYLLRDPSRFWVYHFQTMGFPCPSPIAAPSQVSVPANRKKRQLIHYTKRIPHWTVWCQDFRKYLGITNAFLAVKVPNTVVFGMLHKELIAPENQHCFDCGKELIAPDLVDISLAIFICPECGDAQNSRGLLLHPNTASIRKGNWKGRSIMLVMNGGNAKAKEDFQAANQTLYAQAAAATEEGHLNSTQLTELYSSQAVLSYKRSLPLTLKYVKILPYLLWFRLVIVFPRQMFPDNPMEAIDQACNGKKGAFALCEMAKAMLSVIHVVWWDTEFPSEKPPPKPILEEGVEGGEGDETADPSQEGVAGHHSPGEGEAAATAGGEHGHSHAHPHSTAHPHPHPQPHSHSHGHPVGHHPPGATGHGHHAHTHKKHSHHHGKGHHGKHSKRVATPVVIPPPPPVIHLQSPVRMALCLKWEKQTQDILPDWNISNMSFPLYSPISVSANVPWIRESYNSLQWWCAQAVLGPDDVIYRAYVEHIRTRASRLLTHLNIDLGTTQYS